MLLIRILLFFLFLHLVNLHIQINLHLTDWENEDNDFQHHCLNAVANIDEKTDSTQIISYCMGEWPSKYNIKENDVDQKLTFSQLSKQQITSEQLYHWSAPIDLIEQYQFYLDQRSHSDETLATKIFYNCTLPYFGSKCQYVLDSYNANYSSLDEIISNYYYYNEYEPTLFTCYIHLECNRGPSPSCLDWTEICNGKVDCIDGGLDEEHCWQLEFNQCNENEIECSYGQCIPKAFWNDDSKISDCIDRVDSLDYIKYFLSASPPSKSREPTLLIEDTSCIIMNHVMGFGKHPLTSSCVPGRDHLLSQAFFSIKPKSISNECWTALKCIVRVPALSITIVSDNLASAKICTMLCIDGTCDKIIDKTCPDIIYIRTYPILFGHIYLAYNKSKLKYAQDWEKYSVEPTYVCYNDQLLHVPDDGKKIVLHNNNTCRLYKDSRIIREADTLTIASLQVYIVFIQRWIYENTTLMYNNSAFCHSVFMYKCMNSSKCILSSSLLDNVTDCYYGDDENPTMLNNTDSFKQIFRCPTTDQYILFYRINDGVCDCNRTGDSYCADEIKTELSFKRTLSFQTICDNMDHLDPEFTADKNETDETNCEQWPSLHIYNRCDGFWHFLNGSDEVNCDSSSSILNCSYNNHVCVSLTTKELICLPIEKANDGIIDCFGAADEPTLCQRNAPNKKNPTLFHCHNDTRRRCILGDHLCDGYDFCDHKEDEQVCKSVDLIDPIAFGGICKKNYELDGSDVAKILCRLFVNSGNRSEIYFTLDQSENSKGHYSRHRSIWSMPDTVSNSINIKKFYQQRCHRGLDLQIYLDKQKNLTKNVCLCPPSYYGDICQYQNQRIGVILQIHVTSDFAQTPFIIVTSLIDNTNERIIHSYEQFTFLSMKYCQKEFNFYLLYSTRPKDFMKHYSIHIDFYEKRKLKYRGSIIKSMNYTFLPVHRVVLQLNIPNKIEGCSDQQCINGKCIKYFNDINNRTFCQCKKGWSGEYCTIKYSCLCSSKSLCIGKLANNRSLCVCPLNKMGPRCLIDNQVCQTKRNPVCFNDGECIPTDEYEISKYKFTCICKKGFSGDRCEISPTKLIISIDKDIDVSPRIFIHYIEIKTNDYPVRTTTLKRIPIRQDSIIIYWSLPFHIMFIETFNKDYHLIVMQKIYQQSIIFQKTLNSSSQCLHINQLFNETMRNYTLLRRIKYYHSPCQKNLSLPCFYDEQQLCLCQEMNQERLSNCFNFDHNSSLNCDGKSDCENEGQCFQENSKKCRKYLLCRCPDCYYGARCQLSTSGYSLSLDVILGYHIYPNINFFNQPRAILVSSILSTIIIIGGFINGFLSLITFKNKKTRESGSGIYLLCSSIITLITMIIFSLKFWILVISHMGVIKNESFLSIHCTLIDFFLRLCLTMDQWLTAFVSIERAFITIKGINFNQKKAKLVSKWIIFSIFLMTFITNIHDPIHRTSYEENDDDEKRFWCTVIYSSAIRIIDYTINIFHFIVPIIINIVSAIIIIATKIRQKLAIKNRENHAGIMKEQIREHKSLLIGPCVLITLAIPRLIILFASGCMKSANDSWLFLIGYFISLIPPTLTFILFVLPSTIFKQEFRKAFSHYLNIIRRRR